MTTPDPSAAAPAAAVAAPAAAAAADDATRAAAARPFATRFRWYLAERFPLGPYALLIGALVAAVAAAAGAGGGPVALSPRHLLAFAVVLLAFFHLRVFDEHKDAAADRLAHPERLLSRGIVTLRELALAGAVALCLQAALAALLGWAALAWWAAAVGWTGLMRVEFFAPAWLRRHIVVYALTHNPVVGLLVLFVAAAHAGGAAPGAPLAPGPLVFVALATLSSLGFEVGRKLRAPADERPGQDTYTAALGVGRAAALLVALEILTAAWAVAAALVLDTSRAFAVGAPLVCALPAALALRFARRPTAAAAKALDGAASGAALLLYLGLAADVLVSQGVAWSGSI
jgi:4-hydroxybenzoate polyprenyltransferase